MRRNKGMIDAQLAREGGDVLMQCDCEKSCTLDKLEVERISDRLLATIRDELPEKCQRLFIVKYILEETIKKIEHRRVKL